MPTSFLERTQRGTFDAVDHTSNPMDVTGPVYKGYNMIYIQKSDEASPRSLTRLHSRPQRPQSLSQLRVLLSDHGAFLSRDVR